MSNSETRPLLGPKRTNTYRGIPNFLTRTATDDAAQLSRRTSGMFPYGGDSSQLTPPPSKSTQPDNFYEPLDNSSQPAPRRHEFTRKVFGKASEKFGWSSSKSSRRKSEEAQLSEDSPLVEHMRGNGKGPAGAPLTPRTGAMPRPIGGSEKLGTYSGVFVPTSLNVLSILMFLRFGFILGQSGLLGMMAMLIASYLINLVTTLSISAIATNGTVRGGGAYYLISRSLGPEFGGSIGIVFYLGFVFNTGMNAVGLVDCLRQNFGETSGNWYNWLPESFWWSYLWSTVVLLLCTGICLAGSSIFARASNGLLMILLIATFSIPASAIFTRPWESRKIGVEYTGLSLATFKGNLMPGFTRGAAGSQLRGRENFQDLFGILFPATGGIFAGASMSGDLKTPSKSIPRGTLCGLLLTFVSYTLVIFAMAATITRASFYRNVNVIQDTNASAVLVLLGEFATTFFSSLMGVIGSAKLLQALARDNLLPGFKLFGQGTSKGDEPTYAIIFTYIIAQFTMLCDINQIASFVTMTYLMTFLVTNLACFLLKIGSAPNFRPSFHYFNSWTAAIGAIVSGATMFFVDGLYATGCVGILVVIFLLIHYTTPPKSWGDVSQSLIYHQVRKYLLRLRQEHVKFWRPQILLFVNDPRRSYKLIQFCNAMKKGGLYVLGHVIVASDFGGSVPEARRQQAAWSRYIDFSKVKAFVNIAISPAPEWGARNVVLSAGLGGMRPNIAVLGFYNIEEYRKTRPEMDVPECQSASVSELDRADTQGDERHKKGKPVRQSSADKKLEGHLPTDVCRSETAMSIISYVTILEDLLLRLQINVALAKGFHNLEFPVTKGKNEKKYIDLWPIQMSAEIAGESLNGANVLTTNFDTYTLILQLGCILDTVPAWKKAYTLRVAVFVEYEIDVEEERGRVTGLLEDLRIEAQVLVFWLASGELQTYEIIVNGKDSSAVSEARQEVDKILEDEEWWEEIQDIRNKSRNTPVIDHGSISGGLPVAGPSWPTSSFTQGQAERKLERFQGLRKLLRKSKRRHTMDGLNKLGVSLGMTTHRLHPSIVSQHASHGSASEDSGTSSESDTDTVNEGGDEASSLDVASENDATDLEVRKDAGKETQSKEARARRRSAGESMQGSVLIKKPTRKPTSKPSSTHKSIGSDKQPDDGHHSDPDAAVASSSTPSPSAEGPLEAPGERSTAHSGTSSDHSKPYTSSGRPRPKRQSSMAKFSSKPVPKTTVATEEGGGPSIMFTDTPTPPGRKTKTRPSIYRDDRFHFASEVSSDVGSFFSQTSGYPSSQSMPLSFNDLPSRAQHLILNELIQRHSDDTAVVFTTLPSPLEGTSKTEETCISYLSDLEVLCQSLPPTLLVHSNSMTVTMNL